MKPAVLIVALGAALYYTDLGADNIWQAVILPILDFFLLSAVALWLAGGVGGNSLSGRSGGSGNSLFDFFDGDGGSGCD